MTAKASLGLYDFIWHFKGRFALVLFCVLVIVWRTSGKVYQETGHHYNLEYWIAISAMLVILNAMTIAYFRSDFDLVNGAVTGFTINGDKLSIVTAPLRMPLITNRSPKELKLTTQRFARDRAIYPIRIFPFVKYQCWELRTDEETVYVITKFFTQEAIAELERFLYWKNEEPLHID